jgi:hypothetical protein
MIFLGINIIDDFLGLHTYSSSAMTLFEKKLRNNLFEGGLRPLSPPLGEGYLVSPLGGAFDPLHR